MKKALYPVLFCMAFLWTGCGAGEALNTGMESEVKILTEESLLSREEGEDNADGREEEREKTPFLADSVMQGVRFAYESLTEEEKLWYLDMEKALGNMEEKTVLSGVGIDAGLDETDIGSIFQCVLNDHPELFFVDGYTYTKYSRGEKALAIEFAGAYSMDRDTALARKQEIERGADEMLSGIDSSASEYEKVKYVYETIIRSTEYDLNSSDNQNIYSVFVNRTSVCQGYAKAAQYLLDRLGVECTLVMGTVDTGESHAWNLVKVDGSYYYMDATWGDASYRMEEPEDDGGSCMPDINYDYLCVTTAELLRTHTLGGEVPMPECVATEANYYVREGALFTSFNEEQMRSLFDRAAALGKTDITVKCADTVCFREILNLLIEKQEIFNYLSNDSKTIAYAHNEKQLSLTFWVTNE